MLYQPICKPNQVLKGTGRTVIVTGWTPKEAVARHLQDSEYAAIGNLYNAARGIDALIRNLLANPQVRYLVILNATKEDDNSGSCRTLLSFLDWLAKKDQKDSSRRSLIGDDITDEMLVQISNSIYWCHAKSIQDAVDLCRVFNMSSTETEKKPIRTEKILLPLQEKEEKKTLPGTLIGHRIEGKTIAETWVKILQRIRTTGKVRPSAYDSQWQELIDLVAIVKDEPEGFYFPDPNYLPVSPEFINSYVDQLLSAEVSEGIKYTYGSRLRSWFHTDQIEDAIAHMSANPNSARCVMNLWDSSEDLQSGSPPCLNHIWVRICEGSLTLTATFRSNDMFAAWTANAMGLRALQGYILKGIQKNLPELDLKLGALVTISQSAHIYDDCWDYADKLIETKYAQLCRLSYADPVGNFVIEIEDDSIKVEQTHPGTGESVKTYQGKNAKQVYTAIVQTNPGIQPDHAAYLGAELERASICLVLGCSDFFEQDKPNKAKKIRR